MKANYQVTTFGEDAEKGENGKKRKDSMAKGNWINFNEIFCILS